MIRARPALRWWRIARHALLYAETLDLRHRLEVEHYFYMRGFR